MGERGNDGPSNATEPRPIGGNDSAEQHASTESDASSPTDDESDRLAALEARIERLEAGSDDRASERRDERVADLAEEVAALRETTDRLESTLSDAVDELDAIRGSEYGAVDEKRERQFETAVKSMVAFHQLATEVLDVRVENYEPAAGHADAERVEATRERIADALGVGQRVGADDRLELDDEADWPDPEEAANGGRVFGGDDGGLAAEDTVDAADTTPESEAPDTGVYPPIGGSEGASGTDDDAGSGQDEPAEGGSFPRSLRPDDGDEAGNPWRLTGVEPATARDVRDTVQASRASGDTSADAPPEGEAFARIVGDAPTGGTGRSTPPSDAGVPGAVDDQPVPTDDDD
ncbi:MULTISPECIES: hypothetical protein [Halolamina]|uniref:Uncharacterized protein n=1 Tax=Halolamina pelagica TaxID=699431 RepID=A0A1I5P0S2_9EURY|nr:MULTISPECIES: hypothetical protein [Halolamina]NHX36574.1 hypothetical protein [Halolamina sp. R1-12]SFP27654.1 hypothetical protein SAMN05216277_102293 [Halolamina pelagica]